MELELETRRLSIPAACMHRVTELLIIDDYITSDDVLETEDAWTEYGLPKF